ncbi:MAG: Flp family type IVb pilin [Alphaproteobacteria bacterium]|nr:Flp family type IVb pilin [Alphaproteobacteria bacterium]
MCHEMLSRIIRDQSGATAIEYGLLAGLISAAAIGVLTSLGGSLGSVYNAVTVTLTGVVGG